MEFYSPGTVWILCLIKPNLMTHLYRSELGRLTAAPALSSIKLGLSSFLGFFFSYQFVYYILLIFLDHFEVIS